jgi:NADH-quinone oxidoreductase subunit J
MTRSLVRAAMGLALSSVILGTLMFRLSSPMAAVFELSVCAGLIPALFISAISLTEPLTVGQKKTAMKQKLARFWLLPFLLLALGAGLSLMDLKFNLKPLPAETVKDVRVILWNMRPVDLLGQIMILLTGVFGVVILLKEKKAK